MVRQRALALLFWPGQLQLTQFSPAQRRRAAPLMQMCCPNPFERTHRAQGIGKRQANGVNLADGAPPGQRFAYRLFAEKTVGMGMRINGAPGLIQFGQRVGQQGGERHPTAGAHHPAQLIERAGQTLAPLNRQIAPRQIDAGIGQRQRLNIPGKITMRARVALGLRQHLNREIERRHMTADLAPVATHAAGAAAGVEDR